MSAITANKWTPDTKDHPFHSLQYSLHWSFYQNDAAIVSSLFAAVGGSTIYLKKGLL